MWGIAQWQGRVCLNEPFLQVPTCHILAVTLYITFGSMDSFPCFLNNDDKSNKITLFRLSQCYVKVGSVVIGTSKC